MSKPPFPTPSFYLFFFFLHYLYLCGQAQNFLNNFIYFWLHWFFGATCGLSLVVANGGYSLVAVRGLLIAVASLVAEHRL